LRSLETSIPQNQQKSQKHFKSLLLSGGSFALFFGEMSYLDHFWGTSALYVPSMGQYHARLPWKTIINTTECKNQKPQNPAAGHNF
jgi:hypothetical protein